MKIKLDENIPVRLAGELASLGHDVDTVASEGFKGRPDSDVWSAARREERCPLLRGADGPQIARQAAVIETTFRPW